MGGPPKIYRRDRVYVGVGVQGLGMYSVWGTCCPAKLNPIPNQPSVDECRRTLVSVGPQVCFGLEGFRSGFQSFPLQTPRV